tara:strand:- start:470 stop:607 length:138 start_codon:yes stop_codon:yes gene_type:complete
MYFRPLDFIIKLSINLDVLREMCSDKLRVVFVLRSKYKRRKKKEK